MRQAGKAQSLCDEWCDSHPELVDAALSLLSYSPVLLLGEPGLEPHRFGQWLHTRCSGTDRPFVRIHAADVHSGRLQRLMKAGSWPEAALLDQESSHAWMAAQGGTLFIDELTDLTPCLLHRLENWLRSGSWETLDGTRYTLDARLIAATQVPRDDCARQIPEIYYEMTRGALRMPSLGEDPVLIPRLMHAAVQSSAEQLDVPPSPISTQVIEVLTAHSWPGNLAELRRVASYASSRSKYDLISPDSLPPYLRLLPCPYHTSRFASYLRKMPFSATYRASDTDWSSTEENMSS